MSIFARKPDQSIAVLEELHQALVDDLPLHAATVAASAIQPEPRSILTRNIDSIERALTSAKQHAERLDTELQRVTEELRQTRVSIEAFELAHGRMMEGADV